MILLGWIDLSITAALVLALAGLSLQHRLAFHRPLLVAAIRATLQLLLIGQILTWLFAADSILLLVAVASVMLLAAGREVMVRQRYRFRGRYGYWMGTASMFSSSFLLTLFALIVIVQPAPWYQPQYAIPLLGMLLGNTMNGVSIALDRLSASVWKERNLIEQRLMNGQTGAEAILDVRREATRAGMIPAINGMATAGIVSLPGMMTGQILAGSEPVEAVKYQLMILMMVAVGTGFGVFVALAIGSRRLFDARDRLRIERLKEVSR